MDIKKAANLLLNFAIKRLAEIFAIVTFLAGLMLFLSLFSYSPDDPNFIFPENTQIKNLLGFKGSFVSDLFFQSVGLIAYLISFTFMFTGINIFRTKDFFLIIENNFFIILYSIFGTLLLTYFYSSTFSLYVNGHGGFVGDYLDQTFLNSLILKNENTFYYLLIFLTVVLFLISINFNLKKFSKFIIRILYIAFGDVFNEWQSILIFISVASMILGAVAAIGQTNIKRLMAYSSISHMGYGLAGLATGINEGVTASVLYIFLYVVMNIGSFTCILIMKRKDIYLENIRDLSGLSKNHPLVAFCLTVMLFSLAGIPPLAGFFAKFYIFMAVVKADLIILAVIGLVTSVISAFYYLRIIKIMYFDPEQEKFDPISSKGVKISLALSTLLILFYFLNPSILNFFVNLASKSVQ